jgi:hypothetical protein
VDVFDGVVVFRNENDDTPSTKEKNKAATT